MHCFRLQRLVVRLNIFGTNWPRQPQCIWTTQHMLSGYTDLWYGWVLDTGKSWTSLIMWWNQAGGGCSWELWQSGVERIASQTLQASDINVLNKYKRMAVGFLAAWTIFVQIIKFSTTRADVSNHNTHRMLHEAQTPAVKTSGILIWNNANRITYQKACLAPAQV